MIRPRTPWACASCATASRVCCRSSRSARRIRTASAKPALTRPASLHRDPRVARGREQIGARSLLDEPERQRLRQPADRLVRQVPPSRRRGHPHLPSDELNPLIDQLAGRRTRHRHPEVRHCCQQRVNAFLSPRPGCAHCTHASASRRRRAAAGPGRRVISTRHRSGPPISATRGVPLDESPGTSTTDRATRPTGPARRSDRRRPC